MRILIVEDEERVVRFLRKGLREEGHVVDVARDGVEGLALAHLGGFDVIVLDLMLPGKNGFQVTTELRGSGDTTPILLLTARDGTIDVVRGLDAGADDYLTKPFEFEELLARLRSAARRGGAIDASVLRVADLEMDRLQHRVTRAGTVVDLTPTEYRLLEALLRRAGEVVKRTELLDRVWGMSFDPGTSLIDTHVANLRRKLRAEGRSGLIGTVRGVGYRLRAPEDG